MKRNGLFILRNVQNLHGVSVSWSGRFTPCIISGCFPVRTKPPVSAEIQTTEPKPEYEKIVKGPYVMEFLQIKPDTHVFESDLEQALIDHLQQFLLELGRGFSFVARQKRFTLDGQNFYIDLVFYNYILKCFVLIDLKMGQLTHQDIGQMQMYVNYYTRELMNEGDNPPIGIVLCADKSDAIVKYTLPENKARFSHPNISLICPPRTN